MISHRHLSLGNRRSGIVRYADTTHWDFSRPYDVRGVLEVYIKQHGGRLGSWGSRGTYYAHTLGIL